MSSKPEAIAIVGAGGIFPDAPTPAAFWDNLASGRCSSREVPAGRWAVDPASVFDPAKGALDSVYSKKACFIDGFRFDPNGLALDPEWASSAHSMRLRLRRRRTPSQPPSTGL